LKTPLGEGAERALGRRAWLRTAGGLVSAVTKALRASDGRREPSAVGIQRKADGDAPLRVAAKRSGPRPSFDASISGEQPPTKVGGSWVGALGSGALGLASLLHSYNLAHRATWGEFLAVSY